MLQILSSLKKIEKTLNGRNCNWIICRPQFWYPNYFSFALYAIESKFLLLNWKKLVWKMYFDPKLAVLFRVQKRGKYLISCDSSWSLEQQVVWCQQPLPSLCPIEKNMSSIFICNPNSIVIPLCDWTLLPAASSSISVVSNVIMYTKLQLHASLVLRSFLTAFSQ